MPVRTTNSGTNWKDSKYVQDGSSNWPLVSVLNGEGWTFVTWKQRFRSNAKPVIVWLSAAVCKRWLHFRVRVSPGSIFNCLISVHIHEMLKKKTRREQESFTSCKNFDDASQVTLKMHRCWSNLFVTLVTSCSSCYLWKKLLESCMALTDRKSDVWLLSST